jgi:lipopolysaccharide transport system ATP-binding protein
MDNNLALKVSNLGKKYTIGKQKDGTFRSSLANVFKSAANKGEDFWALKNVNFEVKKGEVVGIIGKNGAGKSTLLKLVSQITKPSQGQIEIRGRVASLLEVGTGFHPELTGRENIFLNGTILGMSRKEVKLKFDEIVVFSGIEKFIDTAVKHYSSGMYVRLAFAVAAHLEPEILIIDEVLAVGDAEFQKKCLGKMDEVAKAGRTVLFVSHNMAAVKNLCTRAILIDKGQVTFEGSIQDAISRYNSIVSQQKLKFDTSDYSSRKRGIKQIYVESIEFNHINYLPSSDFKVNISLGKTEEFNGKIDLSVFVFDELNNTVFQLSTYCYNETIEYQASNTYQFELDKLGLSAGVYKVGVWLSGNGIEQDYTEEDITIEVDSGNIYEIQTANITSIVQKDFIFSIDKNGKNKD